MKKFYMTHNLNVVLNSSRAAKEQKKSKVAEKKAKVAPKAAKSKPAQKQQKAAPRVGGKR